MPSSDNLGTVRDIAEYDDVTDTTTIVDHYVYDAFGNETTGTLDFRFAYTGRAFDEETGLQNNLNRWYDPVVGRWLSEDPIGFEAGDANVYRYVGNAATGFVDPDGLERYDAPAGIVNPNSETIAVVILSDIPAHYSANLGAKTFNERLEKLAKSITDCTTKNVRILNLANHLDDLEKLRSSEERRDYIYKLIKKFVVGKGGNDRAGTLYLVGHRGGTSNEGGAVAYLLKDRAQGKTMVLKGGPNRSDEKTLEFIRDLVQLGASYINIHTCAVPDGKVQKKVHTEFADQGAKVAGSEEEQAYPISSLGAGETADTFGNPDTDLISNTSNKKQQRWRYRVTAPAAGGAGFGGGGAGISTDKPESL